MKYILALVITTFFFAAVVSADDASANFNAGRIIDDSVMTDYNSMNTGDIQRFLESKVTCDTWGTKKSEYGGGTRAQYAASRGWQAPPYYCMTTYSESGVSAAQMIYDKAQKYRINPKVLIVLLQKEQGLITDEWPTYSPQYKTATGYGCPDTAPCDSQYFGLGNQLDWAAKMFRAIIDNSPNWYTPYVLGNNYIQYSPVASCGGSIVNIENRSTQALYNYTPYQPNQAALNAGWGTASCGAYGNRNFYLYFTSWFGSISTNTPYAWEYVSQATYTDSGYTRQTAYEPSVQPNQNIYVEIKARNIGNRDWTAGTNIATRRDTDRQSVFYDQTSWLGAARPTRLLESTVKPGETGTFRFAMKAPAQTGVYNEYFNLVQEGVTHFNDPGLFFSISVTPSVASRNTSNISLAKGQTLTQGQYLLSPDTNSLLVLQEDGNLVLRNDFQVIWSTNTGGNPNSRLVLQEDGNLVLYAFDNKVLWASGTNGTDSSRLTTQADGNLVLYKQSGGASWYSGTSSSPDRHNFVNRKMRAGSSIYPGQRIESTDRKRYLVLQKDGNLVLYLNGKALWATSTNGKKIKNLVMQSDGNLVLYDTSMRPLWNSGTQGNDNVQLVLQEDTNLVIYRNDMRPLWATYTVR